MNKKYELTENTVTNISGKTLYQIKALMDFGNVEKGELGGYIEKEANLDTSGVAWVSGDAWVYGNAQVYGKIIISLGFFFGMRYKKEEIKYVSLEDGQELICKGDIEVNKQERETIRIGDVEFDKKEVEERLKGLQPIK